jgi:putative nucleotidyltransferase with HDIG domain
MPISPKDPDLETWAALAPDVPPCLFVHESSLHGVRHTQRVCVHARRLTRELGWNDADAELALKAALWHDIGRTNDGWDPGHGDDSVRRARERDLLGGLCETDTEIVAFAIRLHCRSDEMGRREARQMAEPERALRILWLLKDADGLDRVRLGKWEAPDPAQLRHSKTVGMIPFAWQLLEAITDPR